MKWGHTFLCPTWEIYYWTFLKCLSHWHYTPFPISQLITLHKGSLPDMELKLFYEDSCNMKVYTRALAERFAKHHKLWNFVIFLRMKIKKMNWTWHVKRAIVTHLAYIYWLLVLYTGWRYLLRLSLGSLLVGWYSTCQ